MSVRVSQVGYWSGLTAATSTVAYVAVQLLQVTGVLQFPLDGILIFGTSLCIVVPVLLGMLSLHYLTEHHKRFWTHGLLIFTIIYAVFVSANYVVQLATVIPAKLSGSAEAIRVLDQTPHSLFWDYDACPRIVPAIAMRRGITSKSLASACVRRGVIWDGSPIVCLYAAQSRASCRSISACV